MHLNSLASFLALAATTSLAAPTAPPSIQHRQNSLQPWQLSNIISFSPSGRPASYPWLTITASLTDPNALTIGTSPIDNTAVTTEPNNTAQNCQAKWLSGESPFGRSWPCDPSDDGHWRMEILETPDFHIFNFDVKFTRVAEKIYLGNAFKKTYEASVHFEAGVNLAQSCGGSGVCSASLREDLRPLDVPQSEVV